MKIENIKYIDCHSHPHDERYEKECVDIDSLLQDLLNDGGATIAIGTDYENSRKAVDLSLKYENVWATIGIHPVDRSDIYFDEFKFDELLNLGNIQNTKKVVGVGECGLDYFYFDKVFGSLDNIEKVQKINIEKDRQKKLFINQINYAMKNNLPLVLHGRPSKNSMDAYRDILDILEGYRDAGSSLAGHAHFFVGNLEIAQRFLNLGFLLSFDGPITFTTEYDEVIKSTPIEMLMIETDSPYAAPMPYRGQINYPKYVIEIARKIAVLKNLELEKVLEITKKNAINLFNLK